jgi:hypothetical protein
LDRVGEQCLVSPKRGSRITARGDSPEIVELSPQFVRDLEDRRRTQN